MMMVIVLKALMKMTRKFKENKYSQMEKYIVVTGEVIFDTVMENTFGLMVKAMMVNGKII